MCNINGIHVVRTTGLKRSRGRCDDDKSYDSIRISHLNDLDIIASYLLAKLYSVQCSPSSDSQKLIQMNCVAVAVIGDKWFVASNGIPLVSSESIKYKINEIRSPSIYHTDNIKICDESGKHHAEMKILSEVKKLGLPIENVYIGVSKPCCKCCAGELDKVNAYYADWHSDPISDWVPPFG